jgi:ubiquitin fusion degradation protein 1
VEYVSPDPEKGKGESKTNDTQGGADSNPWGGGQKLGKGAWKPSGVTGAGGASVPSLPNRSGKNTTSQVEKSRSPTPDFGVDDDEMLDYDSD